MRFTNNNFVGNRNRETSVDGWDDKKDQNNNSDHESDPLYESIEEEIACS